MASTLPVPLLVNMLVLVVIISSIAMIKTEAQMMGDAMGAAMGDGAAMGAAMGDGAAMGAAMGAACDAETKCAMGLMCTNGTCMKSGNKTDVDKPHDMDMPKTAAPSGGGGGQEKETSPMPKMETTKMMMMMHTTTMMMSGSEALVGPVFTLLLCLMLVPGLLPKS